MRNNIIFMEEEKLFFLQTEHTSYVMMLHRGVHLMHLYWGDHLPPSDIRWSCEPPYRRWSRIMDPHPESDLYTSEFWPFEYPVYGSSDFRPPAVEIENEQGYRLCDLKYETHRIYDGKRSIPGLPSLGEDQQDRIETLEIVLLDPVMDIEITLFYSIFAGSDVIARHTEIRNRGEKAVTLRKALSCSIDLKDGNLSMMQFSGTNLRERGIQTRELQSGTTSIESTRGISSHIQNPFTIYTRPGTDEDKGEAYGINLLYSGNFISRAHLDQYDSARLQHGINPFNFSWELLPASSFCTPEAILAYTSAGLNALSHQFHHALTDLLPENRFRKTDRWIGLNTWEACYFDINHEKVLELTRSAKSVGMELITLDDGWFGKRDDERSSLGDWKVNKNKFPHGLSGLSQEIHTEGMRFGLWVEPEMVSPESELYQEHPDWCLHIPERKRSQWRYQLVLDLSKDEVCDHLIKVMSDLLEESHVDYIKWDMNRRLTEVGNEEAQGIGQWEISHRYILGLYRLIGTLTKRFPDICFENCASGGGRYDAGMLYYFPHAWPSDNTDPTSRLKILYGSSVGYPLNDFRSHVTDSPNHQLGRRRSLEFRSHVASCGILGYELDTTGLSDDELQVIAGQNAWYKRYRSVIQQGTFYRLEDPFRSNKASFEVVSKEKGTVIFWFFRYHAEPEEAYFQIKLKGLEPGRTYRCEETGRDYPSEVLMNLGLTVPWVNHDDLSIRWTFNLI